MCSAPVSVGCNAFCIFVMTMMLNPKSLSIATKQSVFFLAQRSISNLLHQMFFQMVYMYNFLTKWNTCVWINASLKDDDAIQRQVKSLYCAVNKLRGTFVQCFPAVKTLYFMPIACQCMLANCGANTHRFVRSAYVLCITMLNKWCTTYPEI